MAGLFSLIGLSGKPLPPLGNMWIGALAALYTGLSQGRLDIAAILASLYPAVTILLAHLLPDGNVSRQQWMGIVAILAAVVLIAV